MKFSIQANLKEVDSQCRSYSTSRVSGGNVVNNRDNNNNITGRYDTSTSCLFDSSTWWSHLSCTAPTLLSASSNQGKKWLRPSWYLLVSSTASSSMVLRVSDASFSSFHRSLTLSSFSCRLSLSAEDSLDSLSSSPEALRAMNTGSFSLISSWMGLKLKQRERNVSPKWKEGIA